jgi:MFS family permease
MRLILGLIKGLVIGGALGFGAYQLHMDGFWNWITYGVVGAVVGLLVGRPFWSHLADKNSTVVVALLKGIVGFGIGAGLYGLARLWGGMELEIAPLHEARKLYEWQFLLGAAIGGLYGAWVEIDDAPSKQPAADKKDA